MKGPGRKDRLKEARKEAAPLVHEDAGKILDETAELPRDQLTPARVQISKARAEHQQKRAAFMDPETFGEKPAGLNVTIDIGALHLDALKAKGSMSLARPAPLVLEGHTEPDTEDDAA